MGARWLLAVWLACVFCAAAVQAQVTASISGTVEDASGQAIKGAHITVKSLETGALRSTDTDDNGTFRVLSLPLGAQTVTAEKEGFKTAIREGIRLEVGQQVALKLRLEVGELRQQVTVSEEAPLVNTTTAPVAGVVDAREVKDLPLNGRSFDNLIGLNAGALNFSALKSANTSTSDGNTFAVDGRRTTENIFLLNGIEYTGASQLAITPGGASGQLLGIDAVREFNVLTDTYGAEYGKVAGAQVTVVTQSGTNELHGTAFEFLRNSDLDARNFFDQGNGPPPFRRNQFGGSLGGPLRKDRLFLFGNYEGFRQALALSNVAVVPDAEAREGLLPNAAGVYKPVAGLNPAMLGYLSYWPQANGPELMVNGIPSGTALAYNNPRQNIREDFGTLRADDQLRLKDWVSAAYTIDDGNNLTPLGDPLFASYETLRSQVGSAQETHVFSPQMLNLFTAGFSRAAFNFDSVPLGTFPSNLDFVRGAGPGGIVIGGGVTTTGAGTITSAGPNNAAGVWNRRNLFTYTDSLQMSKGRHQLSFGVWFQRIQDNEDTASRQLGQATFASLQKFLQGTVSTFQAVPNANELGWRSWLGAWWVQDVIRLRRNLTLEAGLRHEFNNGWNEVSGRAANYVTNADGILETTPRIADSVYTQNNAKKLFGPRIGLAWDPWGNGRTAMRAGFGTYYSQIDNLSFLLNSLPPWNGAVSFANVSLPSLLPLVPGAALPPSCGTGVPAPCTTYAPQGVQANAKTPTVEEWNYTLEQALGKASVLRVSYVGSFGFHGLLSIDPNSIAAQICQSTAGCAAGGVGTTKSTVSEGTSYIPVGTRPNPYLSGGFFWETEGNTSYNALQVDVRRRLTKGLQIRGNYTWSKSLDMNSALTGAQANNQAQMIMNRNDLGADWGPSALNVKYQASLSGRYELPFGHGQRWGGDAGGLEERIVGGWQLNAIATLLSGFPFTPQIGSNRSGDGDTRNPDRPNVNTSFTGPVIIGRPNQWFNPEAFSVPPAGTYGDLGRGTYSGPGLANVDASLFKNLALGETRNLQFRAEFFNVLNRANFGTPNAIVFSNGAVSPSAGLITSTATTSRQIQFGLKLVF